LSDDAVNVPRDSQGEVSGGVAVEKKGAVTRRDVVRGGGAALTLATTTLPVAPAFARAEHAAIATGVVFEDRSGGGRRQAGDPGIPGVLVSNGHDVARTDGEGRYALPLGEEAIIFVIKPTGYAVPLERGTLLPRFYYIHQPEGTPEHLALRHRGIEPTGPLPRSVDFPLTRSEEQSRFDVLLLSDLHAGSLAEIDFIRNDVVNPLIGTKAAFGLTTGDIMSDDLSLYPRLNRLIGQLGVPWRNVIGNHDLNLDAPDHRYSRETFKQTFGPSTYAFEHGGTLFLMLDNVDYLGPGAGGDCAYRGRFGRRQLAFVANVLKETPPDRLVVAAMHIPLRTYLDAEDPASNTADGAALIKLLEERPSISFAGHTHTTEHHYLGGEDRHAGREPHHHQVLTAVSGSWWSGPYDRRGVAAADSYDGTPNGFHVLSIDGNRATTHFVPAKEPNARQMRIMLDPARGQKDASARMVALLGAPIAQESAGATELVVNLFDGGPRSSVEYRIGERGPVRLQRERRVDPFVREVYARNQATKKPWVEAQSCSHVWSARLPADLEAGTHCVKVRAIDEFGREHHDHLVLEVVETVTASVPG
jgi:3',5'-cyclic AMP phosphodiesterase CpdA